MTIILTRSPTPAELQRLRDEVGWTTYDHKRAAAVLRLDLFGVCAVEDHRAPVVGCARVIGDGHYFYVQDVIVKPDHQRRGIGTLLVSRVRDWLRTQPATSYIALACDPPLVKFYEGFGFREAPSAIMTLDNLPEINK